ncbi:hypothetical protein [Cellulomonas sp. Leaf334]|uniref:hypothetical protein n=1 Tax=Cellulomonas sp. Leaf334 TaxID=1736339 RepID=UPI0006FDE335|nr:hypothetical protein [Cellulomonas sp. Leaf334]KQR07745.1 hypothetical protein ASF78_20970 [Cellulomonas sp. Leaf334]
MLKRLTTAAVGVVGLVVIGLGIASATVWRADDVLVATTSDGPHTLVTDPGVLELGGDPVTVKVSVPDGGTVVLAVGRDTDVAGWVGSDAHGQVTGLSGWHTLAVDDVAAPPPTPAPTDPAATEPAPADAAAPTPTEGTTDAAPTAADPTGSDLWVAEVTGTGSAELVWPAQEGRWSLLAVSTGESAPTLALAWPRVVTTPWLWPCVAVGTLLVLVSAWLLLRGARRRRAGLDEPRWHAVSTGSTPAVVVSDDIDAIPVLTRRQMREAAQSHAARPRSGPVPQVAEPAAAPGPAPAEPSRAPVPTGASAAGAGTSRRALRPPTGSIPVTQPGTAPESGRPAPGWAPTPSTTGRAPGTPPPAPGRPSGAPAGPGSTPVGPSGSPAAPSSAPGWSGGAPGGSSSAPGRPSGSPAGPSRAPGWSGGAPPAPGGSAPTGPGRPADEASTAPHGRPSWVRGTAGPPPTSAPGAGPAPVTGADRTGPAGWSAVPPPPGARVRPGSPSGPDSSVHAGRPTWVRPAAAETPSTDDPATAGSRADAWRRAWGLPPTEGTADGPQSETDTRGEQR